MKYLTTLNLAQNQQNNLLNYNMKFFQSDEWKNNKKTLFFNKNQ